MKRRYGALLFIIAMVVALFGTIVLVRDRQNAADQAKKIVVADQAGSNVQTDLLKLKSYAASHMKVNVSFILTGSYNRAVDAAKAEANKSSASYAAAQASCDKPGVDSIRQSRCVATYIAAHGGAISQPKLPDVANYTYHYVGPALAFDLAGLIFLMSVVMAAIALISIVHRTVTKS